MPLLPAKELVDRSQWPSGLRRASAATRWLEFWVRVPQGAWKSACCGVVCCYVEFSVTGRSFVQRSHTDSGVSVCVV